MDVVIGVLVRILEAAFLIGVVGSAIVILMSGVEDVETIFELDELPPGSISRN